MARKKQPKRENTPKMQGFIAGAGEIQAQDINDTLRQNYMPYAMSVIMSRAIPEIDGFKPSHRKLLYTMYKMNLLGSALTKSANIVGQTMKLNPHGDSAIYDTMVRLSRGYEALLHPYVDSKGNFGKFYSRDMAWAASRYTEARLDPICRELFRDIDKDTVDFVDNYDSTMKEPTLLPAAFPSVLVNANTGIAVGMASSICPFNLAEVCTTAAELIRDPKHDIFTTMQAPDFPGGGQIIFDRAAMEQIYKTGRGSIKVRSRYTYDKSANCIDITQIPPTTTIEAIVEKVIDLVKQGKVKEITDIRDETGLDGLKITIDLKRGADPDKLMQRLFRMTTLEDSFSCNFNVLIAGIPRVLGVRELFEEWTAFRMECVRRRTHYDLTKKKEKLHLLQGLERILLDIDRAIEIIRGTELEAEVVPNLMVGFGIDQIQAEYVAEIKLRNINREYILRRTAETEELEKDIADLEDVLQSRRRVRNIIIDELKAINKKYPVPRRSSIVYASEVESDDEEEQVEDYPVTLFLSREGYFKKITQQSLRMSGEQKYKDGDSLRISLESSNRCDLLIFTDRQQIYKLRLADMEETKASALGVYLPSRLQMDDGENVLTMVLPGDYKRQLLLVFENGKVARLECSAYETKTNRKKLVNAYSDKSPLAAVIPLDSETDIACYSSDDRALVFNTSLLQTKTSRTTQGVGVMSLKAKRALVRAVPVSETQIKNISRYRVRSLPAAGAVLKPEDREEQQLSMIED